MCGRFSLATVQEALTSFFKAKLAYDYKPNYNIAPLQKTAVILSEKPEEIVSAQFGFQPSWAKEKDFSYKTINARSETITEKNLYKKAFLEHRCLVLADGFYEWKQEEKGKQPYRFVNKKKELFAMAGIYTKNEELTSFSIITTVSGSLIKPIHDRSPVILDKKDYNKWLGNTKQEQLLKLLKPNNDLEYYPVSKRVNIAKNNDSTLLEPISVSSQSSLAGYSH